MTKCTRPKLTPEEHSEITMITIFAALFILGVALVAYSWGCAFHGLC